MFVGEAHHYPIFRSVWPLNRQIDSGNLDAQSIGIGSF